MADLLPNLFTLMMLILLQAVLGFDNLLYISIESRRVAVDQQKKLRTMGIAVAIGLRLVLLFVVLQLFEMMQGNFAEFDFGFFAGVLNFKAIVTLFGGGFIIYTAMKEIFHLLSVDHLEHDANAPKKSFTSALMMILTMNLIFSFDSMLSAIALTEVFWVLATAIVVSGILMIWMAEHISRFIEENRSFEVLGLFILLIVGILLVTDGGHLAHLEFFGTKVEAMSKTTFYFVIFIVGCVSVVQTRYRNKLLKAKKHAVAQGIPATEPESMFNATDENASKSS